MEDKHYNPHKNKDVISIIRQEDGNYKAWTQKDGKIVEVRTSDPQSALLALITHG